MMYVDFMKNFLLADSSEQMAVRLEMSVIAISSLEPARRKVLMDSTYIMSRK